MDNQNDAPRGATWRTIEYVEGLFGVTRKTVVGWLASGELPHLRLGPRTIRIAEADLEQFIADRRRTALLDRDETRTSPKATRTEELDIRSRCSAPGEEITSREAAA
jgi:excisionase family DNA binding protein